MTSKEQLKYFFKTGALNSIAYGVTRDQLKKALGNTDRKHFSSTKDKYPSFYKYGRLEFYFENKGRVAGLCGIMFQPIPSLADNGLLKCNYNGLTKHTDISKAVEFLTINGIKFKEDTYASEDEAKLLITEGKVNIFFDCQQKAGHYVLHKAGRFVDH